MSSRGVVTVLFAVALLGCARDPALLPGAGANVVSGRPDIAVDTESGVRIYVDGSRWTANPPDLERVMTPVRLTVQNQSRQPVRIQYANFTMTGASGMTYEAIPPFKINRPGPVREEPVGPPFGPGHSFWVSPYLSGYWPGFPIWPAAFPYDPFYYDRLYVRWRQPLPTPEMIRSALPEGVLQPGGQVTGFLFFDKVTDREPRMTLNARFSDTAPGRYVASLAVPLRTVR